MAVDQYVRLVKLIPLQSAKSVVLSAMAVVCDSFVHLFIYLFIY